MGVFKSYFLVKFDKKSDYIDPVIFNLLLNFSNSNSPIENGVITTNKNEKQTLINIDNIDFNNKITSFSCEFFYYAISRNYLNRHELCFTLSKRDEDFDRSINLSKMIIEFSKKNVNKDVFDFFVHKNYLYGDYLCIYFWCKLSRRFGGKMSLGVINNRELIFNDFVEEVKRKCAFEKK